MCWCRVTRRTPAFHLSGRRDSSLPAGESFSQTKDQLRLLHGMGQLTNTAGALMSGPAGGQPVQNEGDIVFSIYGQTAGKQSPQIRRQFLFCDGRIESTPPQLSFPHRGHARHRVPESKNLSHSMKIQCSCGTKYAFDITAGNGETPVGLSVKIRPRSSELVKN